MLLYALGFMMLATAAARIPVKEDVREGPEGNVFYVRVLNDNIQATISAAFRLIKNMSINPKLVEFHQCHANPHSICFLSQYQR